MKVFAMTQKGRLKFENEDRIIINKSILSSGAFCDKVEKGIFAVADGVGGNNAGAVASHYLANRLCNLELISVETLSNINDDLIEYAEYLAHQDMEELYELAKKIKEASDRFISVYSRQMNEKEEIRPFITKVRKGVDFPPELLYYMVRIFSRIAHGIMSDVEKHLSKES